MAGGSGTRLWPVSRDTMPKQFIALLGEGRSTFQAAVLRVVGQGFGRPIVITSDAFRFICAEQLRTIGVEADIILEPMRRDSGPAVAIGAVLAQARDGDEAVCFATAADHVVTDDDAFRADVQAIGELASAGSIMTLGIVPDQPSTEYGYIRPSEEQLSSSRNDAGGAYAVSSFVEKPDRATAAKYLADGYLWNSGNFAFAAKTMLNELQAFVPALVEAARKSVAASRHDLDFVRLDEESFAASPQISIDYAVMEKTTRAGVQRASFGWSDVGSWSSLHAVKSKDAENNVLEGNAVVIDTRNSLVRSEGPLTAVVGLSDVVVVASEDAVLVAAKDQAARVKDMVAMLKTRGHRAASEHRRHHRPWGWYQSIDQGNRFQVKHICVKPGGKLSLQRHHHRAEHWIVVHGTAEVTVDGTTKLVHENEAAYLPIGCTHRLANPGKIELKLIEVQVGSYTGEDDIIRIEDVYARE